MTHAMIARTNREIFALCAVHRYGIRMTSQRAGKHVYVKIVNEK